MPPANPRFDTLLRELAEAAREIARDESGRALRLEGEPMRRVESLLRELLHCARGRPRRVRAPRATGRPRARSRPSTFCRVATPSRWARTVLEKLPPSTAPRLPGTTPARFRFAACVLPAAPAPSRAAGAAGRRERIPFGMLRASLARACFTLGCASVAAGQESGPQFEHAYAHASCAPWDGAAVRVVLSSESDTSRVLARAPRPGLELAAYAGLTRALGRAFRVRREAPNDGRSGGAWWCDGAGRCSAAARGWIRLERMARDSALVGGYGVAFPGGSVRRGSFKARWLTARPLCG